MTAESREARRRIEQPEVARVCHVHHAMLELRDRPGQQLVEAERCSKVERGELRAERRHVDRRYDGSAGYTLVSAQQLARKIVIPPRAFVAWRKERRDRWHRIVRCGHVASCLTRRVPSYRDPSPLRCPTGARQPQPTANWRRDEWRRHATRALVSAADRCLEIRRVARASAANERARETRRTPARSRRRSTRAAFRDSSPPCQREIAPHRDGTHGTKHQRRTPGDLDRTRTGRAAAE